MVRDTPENDRVRGGRHQHVHLHRVAEVGQGELGGSTADRQIVPQILCGALCHINWALLLPVLAQTRPLILIHVVDLTVATSNHATVQWLRGTEITNVPADGSSNLIELLLGHLLHVHQHIPIHRFCARRCGERPVVGPEIRQIGATESSFQIQIQIHITRQAPMCVVLWPRRKLVLNGTDQWVGRSPDLEENTKHPKVPIGSVLAVHAMHLHGMLRPVDKMLRASVQMALHQGIRVPTDGHLAGGGCVLRGENHPVPVVANGATLGRPTQLEGFTALLGVCGTGT
mmetsp:Transcript_49232/g.107366  ORF Transcript_49232/g.107366 Transcript_49232/m.107366 type:complete len:286 (-) Transcript_49232:903-1760(-)